jgi:hypothetical protein
LAGRANWLRYQESGANVTVIISALALLGVSEPDSLDLLIMLREQG